MNVNLGIWGKLTRVVVVLLLLAGFLGVAVWYWPLIQHNENMRKRILELDQQIQKEEAIGKQQKASITISSDPRTLERLAREKLGYAKPGETVIRFESEPTNNPAPR